MSIQQIDPLRDSRWAEFVDSHPRSSVFHTTEWIESLRRTYRYVPHVLTTSPAAGKLSDGIVVCDVRSWLTGSRLVSLPFSDHCEPLVESPEDLDGLLGNIAARVGAPFKYVEIRSRYTPLPVASKFRLADPFVLHVLNLKPGIEEIYSRLHKDGVQRKIRRADRENVILSEGRSETMLRQFYELLMVTRRRHHLPPQPFAWFCNLADSFTDKLAIHLAVHGKNPIAAILTLRHKRTLTYKYGCSDHRFHHLGGMPRLFWQAMEQAKLQGCEEFDLGRTEPDNAGLIRFKDHLGAEKGVVNYWRMPPASPKTVTRAPSQVAKRVLAHLPNRLFRLSGEIFYRHAG